MSFSEATVVATNVFNVTFEVQPGSFWCMQGKALEIPTHGVLPVSIPVGQLPRLSFNYRAGLHCSDPTGRRYRAIPPASYLDYA